MSTAAGGCIGDASNNPPVIVTGMRVVGSIMLVFTVLEFGVGGAAYNMFTNYRVGSWWAAILTLAASVLAIVSKPQGSIIAGIIVASFAIIVCIVGAAVDGIWHAVASTIVSCYNPQSMTYYGQMTVVATANALYCSNYLYPNYQCACTNGATTYSTTSSAGTTDDTINVCYPFEGQTNCGLILTAYPQLLSASTAFCAILAILSLIYAILGCVCACTCCPYNKGAASGTTNPLNPTGDGGSVASPISTPVVGIPQQAIPINGAIVDIKS